MMLILRITIFAKYMAELKIGKKAPLFQLSSSLGEEVALKNLLGQKVILYFYPKDNTPGCTIQAQEFNKQLVTLKKENTVVLGVSKDSMTSHCRFADKFSLKFHLLSDEELKICNAYGVWQEKKIMEKLTWELFVLLL